MSYMRSHTNPEGIYISEYDGKLNFLLPNTELITCDTKNFHYLITERFKKQIDELFFEESELSVIIIPNIGKVILGFGNMKISLWIVTFTCLETEILIRENILAYI